MARLYALGPLIVAAGWAVIGAAWYLNPWFDVWRHAFSDLGSPRASHPWVFNYGLILTGGLVVVYSVYTYNWADRKLTAYGSGLLTTAGVFLALIGAYPSGTRPHSFVSIWFFIQTYASIAVIGAGLVKSGYKTPGVVMLLAGVAGPLAYLVVEATVGWPSVAIGEAYGILVMDVAVVALSLTQRRTGLATG